MTEPVFLATHELTPGTRVLMDDVVLTIASAVAEANGDWTVTFTEPFDETISVMVGVAEVNEDIWELVDPTGLL